MFNRLNENGRSNPIIFKVFSRSILSVLLVQQCFLSNVVNASNIPEECAGIQRDAYPATFDTSDLAGAATTVATSVSSA